MFVEPVFVALVEEVVAGVPPFEPGYEGASERLVQAVGA
jgi:hypothetical protein